MHLTTVVVMTDDEFGNGIPAALCISNKKNSATWITFFTKFRDWLDSLFTKVSMSDTDDSFYNAWLIVMKPISKRILCIPLFLIF